jgi:cytochrome c oxidase subunit 3
MEISVNKKEMKFELRKKTAMPLLWVGIVSIVMIFASLTSAVIVSKGSRTWQTFELPSTFLISTILIVLSSVTFWYAFRGAKRNNLSVVKNGVLLTLILGILFGVFQFISWGKLVDEGIFFASGSNGVSGSFLYALTGIHLAHLVGGLISLLIVYGKSLMSVYNSENLLGLQLSSTYWHFLGGLWVYLYLFLNFIAL